MINNKAKESNMATPELIVGRTLKNVPNFSILKEETTDPTSGEKNWYLEGIFIQGEVLNNNGRVYPIKVLDDSVRDYTKEKIETKRAYGELGHPDCNLFTDGEMDHFQILTTSLTTGFRIKILFWTLNTSQRSKEIKIYKHLKIKLCRIKTKAKHQKVKKSTTAISKFAAV